MVHSVARAEKSCIPPSFCAAQRRSTAMAQHCIAFAPAPALSRAKAGGKKIQPAEGAIGYRYSQLAARVACGSTRQSGTMTTAKAQSMSSSEGGDDGGGLTATCDAPARSAPAS
eukprot:6201813-Pleurochrysis_carterae.AAC.1